jgi:hypothetical protein
MKVSDAKAFGENQMKKTSEVKVLSLGDRVASLVKQTWGMVIDASQSIGVVETAKATLATLIEQKNTFITKLVDVLKQAGCSGKTGVAMWRVYCKACYANAQGEEQKRTLRNFFSNTLRSKLSIPVATEKQSNKNAKGSKNKAKAEKAKAGTLTIDTNKKHDKATLAVAAKIVAALEKEYKNNTAVIVEILETCLTMAASH